MKQINLTLYTFDELPEESQKLKENYNTYKVALERELIEELRLVQ